MNSNLRSFDFEDALIIVTSFTIEGLISSRIDFLGRKKNVYGSEKEVCVANNCTEFGKL